MYLPSSSAHVETMDESTNNKWRYCPLCTQPHALDIPTTEEIARSGGEAFNSAVPVQSSLCSHVLCFFCVKEGAQSVQTKVNSQDVKNQACFVQCPICEKNDAFDAKNPILSTITCGLLKLVQETALAQTESQEAYVRNDSLSSDPVAVNQESTVADGSVKLSPLYSAQPETQKEDLKNTHDSDLVSKYEPEVLIFTQEPTLNNNIYIRAKHESDDESITEGNETASNVSA